jgi:hypothetical protein
MVHLQRYGGYGSIDALTKARVRPKLESDVRVDGCGESKDDTDDEISWDPRQRQSIPEGTYRQLGQPSVSVRGSLQRRCSSDIGRGRPCTLCRWAENLQGRVHGNDNNGIV